jgi:hypothetical protein
VLLSLPSFVWFTVNPSVSKDVTRPVYSALFTLVNTPFVAPLVESWTAW